MLIDEVSLRHLFTGARSQNGWCPDPVSDEELRSAYDLAKWGPTSMNTQPMRLVFLRSAQAKERLKGALAPNNVEKVMTAPVVALIAFDGAFHAQLSRTFPHIPNAEAYFTNNPAIVEPTALRNGSLQAAYFMLALRAAGLNVGPMSGFDPAKMNNAFFSGETWRVNFICGIGRGDPGKVFPRLPRLEFDEVSRTL